MAASGGSTMAAVRETQAQRLARLEAENARLRDELVVAHTQLSGTVTVAPEPPKKRHRARTASAVVLVVIAALLTPVALLANTAQRVLTDSDVFVETVTSSLDDPAVRDYIADQLVIAIREGANLDQLTKDLFDGIQELDISDRAKAALSALEAPATAGLLSVLDDSVHKVVNSEQFADVLRQSLRITHDQLVKTLTGAEDAAVTIGPDDTLNLQLGPLLAQVKQTMLDAGIGVANLIPEVDRAIPIATVDQISSIATAYQLAVVVGTWLPWVLLLLFAGAVALAVRRSVMLVVAGLVLGGVSAILLAIIGAGRLVATSALAQYIPTSAGGPIYDALVAVLVDLTVVLLVLGLTVALVAYLATPWRSARAIRTFADSSADSLTAYAAGRGISTGRFGDFLRQWRLPIRVAIGVVAGAIILFVRPLSPSLIIWTAVIAVLLVLLFRLLERPEAVVVPIGPEVPVLP
jgi:hypothetical protein